MQFNPDAQTRDALQGDAVHHSRELIEELERLDVDAVAAKLNDSSAEVVSAACAALASRGDKQFADRIAGKLKDRKTRFHAVCALSRLGAYHADLVLCLSDPDVGTRCAAVAALGHAGDNGAVEVRKLLKNTDAATRSAACLALGGMGNQKSASAIAQLLNDQGEDSSWLAASLGGAAGRPPAPVRKPQCASIAALGMLASGSYVSHLVDLTTDADWEARACAVEALGNMGSAARDIAGQLAACLDDDTYPVRMKACEALGRLQATQQVDRLADMLHDKSQSVRIEAVKAIAAMGQSGHKYLAEVAELLSDPLNSIKGAAARALCQMGESAFGYASIIAGMLIDEDPFLRLAALEVLPKLGNYGSSFAEDVSSLLQDSEASVRIAAAQALGSMGVSGYIPGIKALADGSDRSVATAAQEVLASNGWGSIDAQKTLYIPDIGGSEAHE